jgi:hypothetical protein
MQLPALGAYVHPADPVVGCVVCATQPCLPALEAIGGRFGAPRDDGDILAAIGDESHLARQPIESRRERFERVAKLAPSRERLLRVLAGRVAGGEPELADQRHELCARIG